MMAVYAVLEPPARPDGQPVDLDRVQLVPDGFSWGAFLFGPLWMLWHRLWLVLLGWLAVTAALAVAQGLLGVSGNGRLVVAALVALLVGLEAGMLRRWTLRRAGWRDHGIVVADDVEAAEQRYFVRATRERDAAAVPPYEADRGPLTAPRATPPGRGGVLGLFPLPGGGR
ncbi:DUF2628 domain-containing protein [Rhodoplanes serenus]|jgi:hypothetical protein|uniref:DUF2628 domain-containing protein n=1 Tax=Rhodoplanes serenus TaxID=200615 RepID=A0A327JMN7_9BRAD|nr:DUF2628 domain-containing protein [Rhodoplanes serenus]MTW15821.1 DUF2628 domain-containing protein [Rhodoplanes serenus]RAI27679.1 hypothetical protein CH340_24170 [Rhodoplanes serenus]